MPHVSLKEVLKESVVKKYAVGAFPGMDYSITEQILQSCEKANVPVIFLLYGPYIFGQKKDEKRWFDAMWDMLDRATVPACMILDHGTYDECLKAIDLGFKSIMFDGSELPLEENIRMTKELLKLARPKGVSVEGEVGHVGGEEGTTEAGEANPDYFTAVADAKRFVEETGVDALAVAIGSQHGVYRKEPSLDLARLDAIRQAVGDIPLVMHGGSGIPDEMMSKAVEHGINKINFVTYLMLSATEAIHEEEKKSDSTIPFWDLVEVANKRIDRDVLHQIQVFRTQPMS